MHDLALPTEDFVIFGSTPLLIHGLLEHTNDLDILARGAAWRRACELARPAKAPQGDKVVRLEHNIEIFNGWMGASADRIIERANMFDGLPFTKLADILAYKKVLGRAKDLEHIQLIEQHLQEAKV